MLHWLKNIFTTTRDITTSDTTLFMQSCTGEGKLSCGSCGHEESVCFFTHGFGSNSRCTMGVQCQKCAKFESFSSEPVGESGVPALKALIKASRCECGGRYARDKPIVCPRCKSVDVQYAVEWMT